jgi:hypothetical protein
LLVGRRWLLAQWAVEHEKQQMPECARAQSTKQARIEKEKEKEKKQRQAEAGQHMGHLQQQQRRRQRRGGAKSAPFREILTGRTRCHCSKQEVATEESAVEPRSRRTVF